MQTVNAAANTGNFLMIIQVLSNYVYWVIYWSTYWVITNSRLFFAFQLGQESPFSDHTLQIRNGNHISSSAEAVVSVINSSD